LESLFEIEYEGVHFRGEQVWVRKVWITLKESCVKEQNAEEFKVDHITAILSHELSYFLDGYLLKYKPRDTRDIMLSFKQEVYDKLKVIKDGEGFNLEKAVKRYFIQCMDKLGYFIQQQREENKTFRIHSLGAVFRKTFRNYFSTFIKKIPYELVHEAKIEHYRITGAYPDLPYFNI
jgi:predicted transcriptional regulator